MGTKSTVDEIAALLRREDAPELRVAAAVVIGAIHAGGREVEKGLASMLDSGGPPLQRPALRALASVGVKGVLNSVLPLLGSRDAEVRSLAVDAAVSAGEAVVPKLKERLATAQGDERKAIDAALARFGTQKDAVTALLAGLEASDPEVARAAALEVRGHVKDADAKTRRMWLSELTKVIERMKKNPPQSPVPMATAVKILGYLEDERVIDPLLAFAKDGRASFAVRQEALIALRFAVGVEERSAEVIDTLVAVAEAPDRLLAQAALMSLAAIELPKKHASRIASLASHADPERARIALEKLSRTQGVEATKALVAAVTLHDRRRVELALAGLANREDAAPLLAAAMIDETDADRAQSLRIALRPHVKALAPAMKKKLVAAAIARLESGAPYAAHVDVAREADAKALGAELTELATTLSRRRTAAAQHRTVLGLLARNGSGTPAHRLELASVLLRESAQDMTPRARAHDPALELIAALADDGVDVGAALRKDKKLDLDQLFYVGFHFAEQRSPLGRELLEAVVEKAGRTKLGKMAKNKLKLSGGAED